MSTRTRVRPVHARIHDRVQRGHERRARAPSSAAPRVPVGVALGVINFLATFDGIAKNSFYQGILGWTSWLMPMSWAVNALGLAFYAVNLILAGVTLNKVDASKIDKLGFDWKTGTFVMSGGRSATAPRSTWATSCSSIRATSTAAPPTGPTTRVAHETGHTLEFAAFGSAFLAADLIGENVDRGRRQRLRREDRREPRRPPRPPAARRSRCGAVTFDKDRPRLASGNRPPEARLHSSRSTS